MQNFLTSLFASPSIYPLHLKTLFKLQIIWEALYFSNFSVAPPHLQSGVESRPPSHHALWSPLSSSSFWSPGLPSHWSSSLREFWLVPSIFLPFIWDCVSLPLSDDALWVHSFNQHLLTTYTGESSVLRIRGRKIKNILKKWHIKG